MHSVSVELTGSANLVLGNCVMQFHENLDTSINTQFRLNYPSRAIDCQLIVETIAPPRRKFLRQAGVGSTNKLQVLAKPLL